MQEQTHKFISVIIVTLGALLGFEALSYVIGIYQLKSSLYVAFYIYAFHIFWLTFLFDLHLKKRPDWSVSFLAALTERVEHMRKWEYFRHYQNYLVLPGFIYWGTAILLFLNPFAKNLKQVVILLSTAALSIAYWYMKEHFGKKLEHEHHWIRVLSLVKLYAAFIIFSAVLGATFYFGFNATFLFSAVFTLTFLLAYQALFQHNLLSFKIVLLVLLIALALAAVSLWVYANWNSEYLTAGLVMLAVYNTLWGILHHHLDKTLNKKIAFEYLAMMVFIVTFLFASHNFNQRIL